MRQPAKIGIRWTIGDVRDRGYETLRLSIWGAWRLFGPDAAYAVCVNSVPLAEARERTGDVPDDIAWYDVTEQVPEYLRLHLDRDMAEGVGWKLVPSRLFPERYEISLDNDCILWGTPSTLTHWLSGDYPRSCVMAEDVRTCFGRFEPFCGAEPRNAGIRGLPPGFDLDDALREILLRIEQTQAPPCVLTSELDEQGLQTAALSLAGPLLAVSIEHVTVCSPFYPHVPHLGSCGAHFVGLNARHIPWDYYDRPADECMTEFWNHHRPELYRRIGISMPAEASL